MKPTLIKASISQTTEKCIRFYQKSNNENTNKIK